MNSRTLAHTFRRAALPLAWYYAVTLGIPLANGAAQSGAAFVNHALFVVAVPPLLVVLVCMIQQTAQLFASAWRYLESPSARTRRCMEDARHITASTVAPPTTQSSTAP